MKRLLILPLLLLSLSLGATKVYVATDGNDGTGDGTVGNPYLTIATGISHASAGDTVFIVAGTYNVSTQIVLPVGISLMGAGETSVITTATALDPIIVASSVSLTSGNQSISYLKFDGDLTALSCLDVHRRTNFKIHHCTFIDFFYGAIEFFGGSSLENIPAVYATGNEIYSCTIDNCCERRDPGAFGAIRFGGQEGMLIHDNILTQVSRAATHNGNLLYMWGATNKALKFYNNTCTKPATDGVISGNAGGWNFHIESGYSHGYEIYNNTFIGGVAIDYAGGNQVKGDYDYSWWVHHNTFKLTAQISKPATGTHSPMAMDFERTCEDIICEYNIMENYPVAVNFTTSSSSYVKNRIYFRYNIFKNAGYSDASYAYHITWQGSGTGDLAHYLYFENNVFHANLGRAFFGLLCPYDVNHIYIRNNIMVNAHLNGWMIVPLYCGDLVTLTGSFTDFYIDNNLMYNNANSNLIRYVDGKTMTIASYTNNIIGSDPLFKSNETFRLRPTSPAIDAGLDVGLTKDYHGHRVPQGSAPDIGVSEVGNYVLFYNGKQLY